MLGILDLKIPPFPPIPGVRLLVCSPLGLIAQWSEDMKITYSNLKVAVLMQDKDE
jgi:hypothetical protein